MQHDSWNCDTQVALSCLSRAVKHLEILERSYPVLNRLFRRQNVRRLKTMRQPRIQVKLDLDARRRQPRRVLSDVSQHQHHINHKDQLTANVSPTNKSHPPQSR